MTIPVPVGGLARSEAMQEALRGLHQAISAPGGVLLRGERGTGREQFARAIHLANSNNYDGSVERLIEEAMNRQTSGRPFVAIDCAAAGDLERRLFGAPGSTPGGQADGLDRITEDSCLHSALDGTLFLRQIPELPSRLQTRLARVLRDGEVWVETKDGTAIREVTLRAIATIERTVDEERLLPDLRKRLEHTTIDVPVLRERREDIPALVRLMLIDVCGALDVPVKTASTQATELLAALPWHRNLDELRDLLHALAARTPARLIRLADVLSVVRLDGGPASFIGAGSLKQARARFEREYVALVLEQHQGRMAAAAKALGIQRTNLYRKVRQLDVNRRRQVARDA